MNNPQDDTPTEIDFSGGQRGKFYRKGAALRLPDCLDAEVQQYPADRAGATGIAVQRQVNDQKPGPAHELMRSGKRASQRGHT